MSNVSNVREVIRYYRQPGSRLGYRLFLNGTKHFGFYGETDSPWAWSKALRRMEDRMGETLAQPAGARVLDAGCGVGDVAGRLAGRFGLRIHGVDLLDAHVAQARRRARRRGLDHLLTFSHSDYAALDFPDESFDAVYTMETLVHAADAEAVLEQFHRVLKPGGRLVMFEYAREAATRMPAPAAEVFRELNDWAAMPSFQRFTYGTLERLTAEAGFSVRGVEDISRSMWPMLRCFAVIGALPGAGFQAARLRRHSVNTLSAVEFWRHRNFWRYEIHTADKVRTAGEGHTVDEGHAAGE
ncbi:class I SAM-dependent methyltransferase [Streptomyces monomycini]|uniref:class I SAM-dependent methyltransferase n=1 Tax=Streptomyces monomycini TaxID=371720 RepID=UPI001AD81392|nr:class I SAM-dependent methyltransferase [Streptomyces monomycini]